MRFEVKSSNIKNKMSDKYLLSDKIEYIYKISLWF